MDWLLSQPWLPYVAAVLALLVAYRLLASRLHGSQATGMVDGLLTSLLGPGYAQARLQRHVNRLKSQGNHLIAGKLLEDHGRLTEAAETYLEGREHYAAAAVLERAGRLERAAELYLQAADFKKAAQVFTAAGKPGKAAVLFLEKGNHLEAAKQFAAAGMWDRAAEYYEKSGFPLRAAEAHEKKGDLQKAAEAYERHFLENVSYATTYASTSPTTDMSSARQAGRLFLEAGDLARAQEILTRGGFNREAAEVALRRQQYARAAELYLKVDDFESAAAACEAGGDQVRAANLRGELALKADQTVEAAAWFEKGQDHLRAAELFESVGRFAEAADAYAAAESHAAAGSVWVRAGRPLPAAESYARAGEWVIAARLFEEAGEEARAIEAYAKAGLTFKSGEAAAKAGDHPRAIALLQQVPASDEHYRRAGELLAELLIESGRPEVAAERVLKVLGGEPLSRANLDLHYWLAVSREASGSGAEAAELYKKIQSEDLHHRDVEQRLARLSAARPAEPALVGPYRVEGPLRRDPLGEVLRALDPVAGRAVALRVFAFPAGDAEALQRFLREAQAAARLSHPHVAVVYEVGQEPGRVFVAGELLDAGDLRGRAGASVPLAQRLAWTEQVADALAFAHARGVLHRDLQPAHVLLAEGGVRVDSFGLAPPEGPEPRAGVTAASAGYLAPEQVRGDKADPRVDVFAAGVLFYELLSGRRPFESDSVQSTLHRVLEAAPPPLEVVAPDVPAPVAAVVARAMEKDPARRYANGGELLQALRGARGEGLPPQPAAPTVEVIPAPAPVPAAPGGYRLGEPLGRGPLGVVHRGEDPSGAPVAIRVLPDHLSRDPELMAALNEDVGAARAVSLPSVARVSGVVNLDGRTCVVGELVEGKNLEEPLRRGAKMGVKQANGLGRILAQSLSALHALGLVHGSLQPTNVVVVGGAVKLTDLGLGRLAPWRRPEEIYRAPGLRLDPAGDLFDLATLLYHLLTGVHPKTQPQGPAMPLPSTLNHAVPEAFDKLLLRALHPREDRRLPDAEAFLVELRDMVRIG